MGPDQPKHECEFCVNGLAVLVLVVQPRLTVTTQRWQWCHWYSRQVFRNAETQPLSEGIFPDAPCGVGAGEDVNRLCLADNVLLQEMACCR